MSKKNPIYGCLGCFFSARTGYCVMTELSQDTMCTICTQEDANMMANPCRHMFCGTCICRIWDGHNAPKCPFCRQPILGVCGSSNDTAMVNAYQHKCIVVSSDRPAGYFSFVHHNDHTKYLHLQMLADFEYAVMCRLPAGELFCCTYPTNKEWLAAAVIALAAGGDMTPDALVMAARPPNSGWHVVAVWKSGPVSNTVRDAAVFLGNGVFKNVGLNQHNLALNTLGPPCPPPSNEWAVGQE